MLILSEKMESAVMLRSAVQFKYFLQFWAVLNFLDLFSAVFIKFTGTVILRSARAYYVYMCIFNLIFELILI